jgi:putative oxidoreductase
MADSKTLAALVLRLALGTIFIAHGAQKLGFLEPGRGWQVTQAAVQNFSTHLAQMNVEPAVPLAWATALTEFLGGVFCLLGLATRFSAAAIAVVMCVAVWKVHLANGFIGKGGFEYNLMILAACAALGLQGGGALALDAFVANARGKNQKKI